MFVAGGIFAVTLSLVMWRAKHIGWIALGGAPAMPMRRDLRRIGIVLTLPVLVATLLSLTGWVLLLH
jgi:hypothetical protein